MPNGFRGTDGSWARLEAPILRLDPALEAFARDHGLVVSRNYHNWPERSLTWGAPIKRLIQVYLEDEEAITWNVWICASEDRRRVRYWRNAFVKRAVPIEEIESALPELLEDARFQVGAWQSDQLEFAANLS